MYVCSYIHDDTKQIQHGFCLADLLVYLHYMAIGPYTCSLQPEPGLCLAAL